MLWKQHVGRAHEPFGDLPAGRLLQVHGDALLARVHRHEGAHVAAPAVAGQRLDFDHLGAELAQELAGGRTGD